MNNSQNNRTNRDQRDLNEGSAQEARREARSNPSSTQPNEVRQATTDSFRADSNPVLNPSERSPKQENL